MDTKTALPTSFPTARQPLPGRAAALLSLLQILESLRQAQGAGAAAKV